jgi:CelD/BcsL family acetyltransferase involved in cellulose biosynthesis
LAPEFSNVLGEAGFLAVWRDVLRRLRSHPDLWFDTVALDKMQTTVGAQPNPFVGLGVMPHPDGAYKTALSSDWEKFYNDKRSSATRRRDRSKRKKLAEAGEIKFVTPTAPGDLAATLETLIAQKSESFASMGVANIFMRPGFRPFYRALAAQPRFVHVSRLDVGEQTVATNLGLVFRSSYYHLLASYTNGELSKFGPGAAHMHDLLRYAIGRGCTVFDFTIGDERYKQEWCDGKIELFDHVRAATPRGAPDAVWRHLVTRLKHVIKQTPALWTLAFKVRAVIGPMLQGRTVRS